MMVMAAIQICRNCDKPVKFEDDENQWLHVTYRSAHTITFGGAQCELYATPPSSCRPAKRATRRSSSAVEYGSTPIRGSSGAKGSMGHAYPETHP
jgi:hypothetical protein